MPRLHGQCPRQGRLYAGEAVRPRLPYSLQYDRAPRRPFDALGKTDLGLLELNRLWNQSPNMASCESKERKFTTPFVDFFTPIVREEYDDAKKPKTGEKRCVPGYCSCTVAQTSGRREGAVACLPDDAVDGGRGAHRLAAHHEQVRLGHARLHSSLAQPAEDDGHVPRAFAPWKRANAVQELLAERKRIDKANVVVRADLARQTEARQKELAEEKIKLDAAEAVKREEQVRGLIDVD